MGEVDPATLQSVKEIRIKGYALILKQEMLEDIFKEALKKQEDSLFDLGDDANFVMEEFTPARGENNLTAFTIRLKLKEPIKK